MNPGTHHTPLTEAHERLGQILNHALADEFALSAVTRDYRWNVTGPHFRSLHETFDEQYHQIDDWVDRIGERARTLGITPRAGWRELVRARRFRPASGAGLSAGEMIAGLAALHGCVAERLQADVDECNALGDATTARLLGELIEYHETTAWVLGELQEERELAQA
jgi:starvation-inducible DNA-binding protein